MTDLFSRQNPSRQTGSAAPADPRLHLCACGAFGMFGQGPTWFCRLHVPAGFLPHTRGQR